MPREPKLFIIAGEASGDWLGARLMQALKRQTNNKIDLVGIGGPRMRAEGIELFFKQEELAHMGFFELVRHVPRLLKRIKETTEAIRNLQPSALITIDSPDFCFRIAKRLKGEGIPLIHYVAPTVWAWRPGRAKKVASFLDHLLTLLPFEPPYFLKEGLATTFVGHSIVESDAAEGNADRFRTKYSLPTTVPLLTMLPGSRKSELDRLLPIFFETVMRLKAQEKDLRVVIPTVPHLLSTLSQETSLWPIPVIIVESDQDKYDAFAASRVALACSGTVSVELAMARLPMVIAYKTGPLTAWLAKRLVKTKFVSLVNIMHKKMIVPEHLLDACNPETLSETLLVLLNDETTRRQQIEGLETVATWLGQGQFIPSERAAETILKAIATYKKSAA